MEILHIVAGLPPGGGIAESVPALCRHLQRQGHTVVLATVARADERLSEAVGRAEQTGVRVVRFRPSHPHFLFFSWEMLLGLGRFVRDADVVHVHSNWTFPVWWGCWCARRAGKKLVMSPRGCLDSVRLRHSAWKKRLAGILDQFFLRRADVVHVTCGAEAAGVERYLGGGPRIVVISNGVEVDAFEGEKRREDVDRRCPECGGKRVALFLSRLHPLKGLDLLVAAWKEAAEAFDDWHLLIAGPDENGYQGTIERMVQRAGIASRVTFCGPLYGDERAAVMRAVDLFVLPTRHENFGMVVPEALASGVPVICTKGAPWGELVTARCGWWVEVGVEPLAEALREAMALGDEERREMGRQGRRLVQARYT
ncbi:MAG: glycosyltransferase, partial [Lentisphaerae bacterium]|nr:glycosyltransferase [Lentisphaerota bacterium]